MATQERLREVLYKIGTDINKVYTSDPLNAWCTNHYFKLIDGRCVGCEAEQAIIQLIETEKEELLDALYWMYTQYCGKGHDFMGAGETASELLENAGYITVDGAGVLTKDNGDSEEQRTTLRGEK